MLFVRNVNNNKYVYHLEFLFKSKHVHNPSEILKLIASNQLLGEEYFP